MQTIEISDWKIEVDPVETRALYADISSDLADKCDCAECRRFERQRKELFPPEAYSLLSQLGIEPDKEVEIVNLGDPENGGDEWNWWYLFIGRIISGPSEDDQGDSLEYRRLADCLSIRFTERISIPVTSFRDRRDCVQIEFYHSSAAVVSC